MQVDALTAQGAGATRGHAQAQDGVAMVWVVWMMVWMTKAVM